MQDFDVSKVGQSNKQRRIVKTEYKLDETHVISGGKHVMPNSSDWLSNINTTPQCVPTDSPVTLAASLLLQ